MNDANMTKLLLVRSLFRLQNSDFQRHTGFSKGYVSGLFAGKVKASPQFWMKLNASLPKIIAEVGSDCCVFDVEAVQIPDEKVLNGLKKAG